MKLKKYSGNPILSPNPHSTWDNFCVLNPAVVYDEESKKFIMVYRAAGDDIQHVMRLGRHPFRKSLRSPHFWSRSQWGRRGRTGRPTFSKDGGRLLFNLCRQTLFRGTLLAGWTRPLYQGIRKRTGSRDSSNVLAKTSYRYLLSLYPRLQDLQKMRSHHGFPLR